MTTATDAPHRKARISSRRRFRLPPVQPQVGQHDDRHRRRLDSTKPIDVPTGLNAVSAITISPAMVPSRISTPSGAPTLRTFF